jgi:hypothetical protein
VKCSIVAQGLMALLVVSTPGSSKAQSRAADEDAAPLIRADSTFVWVPTLVKTENGGMFGEPDVGRFHLLDNGNPEKVSVINTDGLPISLVILMQTGGSASRFLSSYSNLPELIGRLVGDSVHEITLVTFDSRVEQIWHSPVRSDGVNHALTHQHPGNKGAAIKDALAFGVRQLQSEPGRFRRIVLLLSQKRDIGSSTSSQSLLEQLGTSSTVVYSLTFPGEKTHLGQARGTRHTGAMEEAAEKIARTVDDRTAQEVSSLTGGTDRQFVDRASFNSAMLETVSDFHSGITLGFQPSRHQVGFHRIDLTIDSPGMQVTSRSAYWWTRPE